MRAAPANAAKKSGEPWIYSRPATKTNSACALSTESICAGVDIHVLPQLSATVETPTVAEFHHTYKASRSPCCGWPLHPWATVVAALVLALARPRTKNPPAAGIDNGATVNVTVILAGENPGPAEGGVNLPV